MIVDETEVLSIKHVKTHDIVEIYIQLKSVFYVNDHHVRRCLFIFKRMLRKRVQSACYVKLSYIVFGHLCRFLESIYISKNYRLYFHYKFVGSIHKSNIYMGIHLCFRTCLHIRSKGLYVEYIFLETKK